MRKITKVLSLILLIAVATTFLTGCGGERQAEKTVETMMDAFSACEFETAEEYLAFDVAEAVSEQGTSMETNRMMEIIFSKMDYKILSSEEIESGKVQVLVEVTTLDMGKVMTEFFGKAIAYVFGNVAADPQPTEEEVDAELEKMFEECAKEAEGELITREMTVMVTKEEESWKVDADETAKDVLLGGLLEAVENLEASFAE